MRHALLIATGLLCALAPVAAQSQGRVDRVSAQNFQTTAKQLETALQSRGFMIVARADHQNMLRAERAGWQRPIATITPGRGYAAR